MTTTMHGMSDGLLRQRRNLLISSILLWFLQYAGVEISQLSVLGIEFEHFENSDAVYISLWLGWTYFLIRYCQYFFQDGYPRLIEALSYTLDVAFAPKIKKKVLETHPKDTREECGFRTLKKWDWTYYGQEKVGKDHIQSDKFENFTLQFSPWMFWKEILSSILSVSIKQSLVTDYILPFFLALYIAINGFSGWKGGVYELFLL